MSKTSAPSALRNREAILDILKLYLSDGRLLEIGSGTAEHGIFFAKSLENIHWITSDIKSQLFSLKANLKDAKLKNLHGPELLEIGKDDFPKGSFDYAYTSNTLHIMSWKQNKSFFKLLGKRLREGALVFIYGPFNYNNEFISEGNKNLDEWLKESDPKAGIRNYEDIYQSMIKFGFKLLKDHQMPANNRLLVFERLEFKVGESQ